jgi:hypothetical protein
MNADKLIKLDELRKSGLLTEEEFATQKAKLLSDDNSDQKKGIEIKDNSSLGKIDTDALLKIPLGAGWVVNIVGWVLFVSTMNPALEIITALLCIGCVYFAYKHKQAGTPPFFGMSSLSAGNLIYASAFEAIWMLAWGLGVL